MAFYTLYKYVTTSSLIFIFHFHSVVMLILEYLYKVDYHICYTIIVWFNVNLVTTYDWSVSYKILEICVSIKFIKKICHHSVTEYILILK